MELNTDIYSESDREVLEDAIHQSVDSYVERQLKEEDIECPECGSGELSAESEKDSDGIDEKAVCDECGEEVSVEVEAGDLRSGL